MTTTIIIILCTLLLLAYLFDLSASKTKIPSVIFLLFLGWLVKTAVVFVGISVPDMSMVLPILGTVGLILIVLEGSLELELSHSKIGLIKNSLIGAVVPLFGLALVLAFLFNYFEGFGYKASLTNAIPFCIISSAIAIPSVRNLMASDREFVIYESSLSDIVGVLFFNFVALNQVFDFNAFGQFGLQVVIILVISFAATIALSFLLSKIEHHIKFLPIIILIILIYALTKEYHLPGLIFIMIFGMFISNIDLLRKFNWVERFKPEILKKEVHKFRELTAEAAFLVRALFFLLFGYLIETSEILNTGTILWAIGIVLLIFSFRFIQLKLTKMPQSPLLFIAPRGLITILLFLSIDASDQILIVNKSLIIQVVLITALIMMAGLMTVKSEKH